MHHPATQLFCGTSAHGVKQERADVEGSTRQTNLPVVLAYKTLNFGIKLLVT